MFTTILLSRKLGVTGFGQWSLIIATTSWVTVLHTSVGSDLIRRSAQDSQYARLAFWPALLVLVLGGNLLGVAGIVFNSTLIQTSDLLIPSVLIMVAFITMGASGICVSVFTGRDRMQWQLRNACSGLLVLIGLFLLSRGGLTINTVAEVYLGVYVSFGVLFLFIGMRLVKPLFPWWPAFPVRRFLVDLGQLMAANWLIMLHLTVELYLLQLLLGSEEVGLYNAAFKLVIVFRMLPLLLMMSLVPEISRRAAASDLAFIRQVWVNCARILLLVAGMLALAFLSLAHPLIGLAYSAEYGRAVSVLMILSFSLFPLFMQSVTQSLLYAAGRYRDINLGFGLGLVVQVIADLALISLLGLEGAAVAFFVAECATFTVLAVFAVRAFGKPRASLVGKTLACSLVAICLVLIGSRLPIPVGLLFGSVATFYLLLSFSLGCICPQDVQLSKSLLTTLLGGGKASNVRK